MEPPPSCLQGVKKKTEGHFFFFTGVGVRGAKRKKEGVVALVKEREMEDKKKTVVDDVRREKAYGKIKN